MCSAKEPVGTTCQRNAARFARFIAVKVRSRAAGMWIPRSCACATGSSYTATAAGSRTRCAMRRIFGWIISDDANRGRTRRRTRGAGVGSTTRRSPNSSRSAPPAQASRTVAPVRSASPRKRWTRRRSPPHRRRPFLSITHQPAASAWRCGSAGIMARARHPVRPPARGRPTRADRRRRASRRPPRPRGGRAGRSPARVPDLPRAGAGHWRRHRRRRRQ